jgi:hypothetical protein
MKRTRLSLLALALLPVGLAGILSSFHSPIGVHPVAKAGQAAHAHVLGFDVAADCRTVVSGTNRGDLNMVSGKIFPFGTLPSGIASNDPTLPVNGTAPIGDWHHRSQQTFPLPPDPAYGSTPPYLATFYFIFHNGHALITENYGIVDVKGSPTVLGVVTGGIGRFSGAAGDVLGTIIGTNATGCPNGRNRFNIRPGSMRGGWNN